jgi:hypothetical protein
MAQLRLEVPGDLTPSSWKGDSHMNTKALGELLPAFSLFLDQ